MDLSAAAIRYLSSTSVHSNYDRNGNKINPLQNSAFRRQPPMPPPQRTSHQLSAIQRPYLLSPQYDYSPTELSQHQFIRGPSVIPSTSQFKASTVPPSWKKTSQFNDQTFVIEKQTNEVDSFRLDTVDTEKIDEQLSFINMEGIMTSDYFSNCKTDSDSTPNHHNPFISPLAKRRRVDDSDFFDSHLKLTSSMDIYDESQRRLNTESLFDESLISPSQIYSHSQMEIRPSENFSLDTCKSPSKFSITLDASKDSSIITIESSPSVLSQRPKAVNFDILNQLMNKKKASEAPQHNSPELEKRPPSQSEKVAPQSENDHVTIDYEEFDNDKVNTFYSTNISKSKQNVPIIDLQNPSYDGVNKLLSIITITSDYDDEIYELGDVDQNFHTDLDESGDYYGEIMQSLEEIEMSFVNPMNFTTSTPERVNRFIKEEMPAVSGVMVILPTQPEEILQITESCKPSWTQITHISASIPMDNLDNYEFALNSVLNITQKNLTTGSKSRKDESHRIDLLLSMIQEQSLFDETLLPLNADKSIAESRRAVIMAQIEGLIQTLLSSLSKGKPMVLKILKVKDFKDCEINNAVLSQKETAISLKSISFTNKSSARTFTILTTLLCEIYKLLSKNTSCTKRELYYRDTDLMVSQNAVNKALEDICILLNVSQWELGILSSSKGLVAGDLQFIIGDDEVDCNTKIYAVPQNPSEIKSVQSSASYILVVEKDTVFTKLIQEKIFEKSQSKIIMVTAKGYPDINTRVLLKRLETDLQIPIYILVDADPHGIEIMCTYKFGSLQMVHNSQQLAVSSIEWIGVYPSDIETLSITHTEMTAVELKKVDELLERPYMNAQLKRELTHLKTRKLKAEIENIYKCSIDYLIKDYIPQKIRSVDEPLYSILNAIHGEQADDIF